MLLFKKPKDILIDFINMHSSLFKINKNEASAHIAHMLKFSKNDNYKYKNQEDLQKQWYAGLEKSSPDYTVYNDQYYFAELWACWIIYSRKYLRTLVSETSMPKCSIFNYISKQTDTILDLGCGIGYTTAALSEIFKNKIVIGTNIKDTEQWIFCKKMAKQYNFKLKSDPFKIKNNVDFIFASEYFEHIYEIGDHLQRLIDTLSPKYMLIANSFDTRAVGHFTKYKFKNIIIDQKGATIYFNKMMNHNGYVKIKTKAWNQRPTLWERNCKQKGLI
jgi:SAM-dependent methyltransferase